jgi:hypothetical protein
LPLLSPCHPGYPSYHAYADILSYIIPIFLPHTHCGEYVIEAITPVLLSYYAIIIPPRQYRQRHTTAHIASAIIEGRLTSRHSLQLRHYDRHDIPTYAILQSYYRPGRRLPRLQHGDAITPAPHYGSSAYVADGFSLPPAEEFTASLPARRPSVLVKIVYHQVLRFRHTPAAPIVSHKALLFFA